MKQPDALPVSSSATKIRSDSTFGALFAIHSDLALRTYFALTPQHFMLSMRDEIYEGQLLQKPKECAIIASLQVFSCLMDETGAYQRRDAGLGPLSMV